MEHVFLSISEVTEIHKDQINRYGGTTGIRDLNLLQSALAMPASGFGGRYLHENFYEMAAAYLFHIVQNHPFLDGNKRTGAVTALIFLEMNGVDIDANESIFEKMVREVSEGKLEKKEIAKFFEEHAKDQK